MARAELKAPRVGGRGSVPLDPVAFGASFNMPLVHETVRAELNARRRGTASTLTRGKVRGGGAKPWRQKGTGRARAGSSRSPLWAGGGTIFGPTPRRYTVKVNRKARRAALRSALSQHASRGTLAVFDAARFDEPSTAQAAELISKWDAELPALVLLGADEAAAGKSFRNLARVSVMPVEDGGVADIVGAASLLVSQAALESLVARAGGSGDGVSAAEGADAPADAATSDDAPADAATSDDAPADAATSDDAPDSGGSSGTDEEAA